MPRVSSFHHLAASTANMKSVIDFSTQVLGMELVGLFEMHGVPGGIHSFLRLNNNASMSFVFLPPMADIDEQVGVTHAAHGGDVSAPGTTQHLAFGVDNHAELLGMRDRIRSHGYRVDGPIDHGFCQSIYFRGPEGALLEIAYYVEAIDAEQWIDPKVVAQCGIDGDELASYCRPDQSEPRPVGSVPQPTPDPAKPHVRYPDEVAAILATLSDEQLSAAMSFSAPPVP